MNTNNISIFNNDQFGEIRALMQNGEPWFIAKDICDALGFEKPADAVRGLDDDEKGTYIMRGTQGNPDKTIISEAGLYSLILRSRKPEAKMFKRWVTHEVLPQIRKTGGYIPVKPEDTDLDIMVKAAQIMQATIERQKVQIAEAAPKVVTYDDFLVEADDNIPMAVLANRLCQEGLPFGLHRLFAFLRRQGVLCSTGSRKNLPTQKYMEKGWFKIIAPPPYGDESWKPTLRITPKGVAEITTRIHELLDDDCVSA